MTAVDTLITLLDHVDDVDQLEIFLDAENLQRIMHAAGHDDAAMRRMVVAGATPGSMLLGVLQTGRTPAELMEVIPLEARKVKAPSPAAGAKKGSPTRSAVRSGASSSTPEDTNTTVLGFVLLLGGAVVCALGIKLPMAGLMALVYWPVVLGVVALLGAMGGAVLLRRKRALGAVLGAFASPLATFVGYRYIRWMASDMGRESLLIVEPILVNMLVVAVVMGVPMRLWSKRAD